MGSNGSLILKQLVASILGDPFGPQQNILAAKGGLLLQFWKDKQYAANFGTLNTCKVYNVSISFSCMLMSKY